MNIRQSLRQWKYPKELRIPRSAWPEDLLAAMENFIRASKTIAEPAAAKEDMRFLADLGTGLWRLQQKMVQPGSNKPTDEMRRAYRHLESVWDAMTKAGIQIKDHTGEPIPEGGIYGLKIIAAQPTQGITREKVFETIKPSIYYKDRLIQMGEVIIGKPQDASSKKTGPEDTMPKE